MLVPIILVALGIAAGIGIGYWKNLANDFGIVTGVIKAETPSRNGLGFNRRGSGSLGGIEQRGPYYAPESGGGRGRAAFRASRLINIAGYAVLLGAFAVLTHGIDRRLRKRRVSKATTG